MAVLNRNNCHVDPKSGGIVFKGSPELQEIINIRADISALNTKLDKLMKLIEGGVQIGRKMEDPRLSKNNDQEVQ